MESARLFIRDNCKIDRVQHAAASLDLRTLLNAKAIPYVLLALATVALAIKHFKDKQQRSIRSRSPDPEKPTDVNTFAEKRMKPTERPPGGMHQDTHNFSIAFANSAQYGFHPISNDQRHRLTLTGPSQTPSLCHTDPSVTGPTTSPWVCAA